MMGAPCRWILAGIAAIGLALPAGAADRTDVTDADRVYRNYIHEAATVQPGQIRLEVRGMTFEDDTNTKLNLLGYPVREEVHSETGSIFDVLGSYGLGNTGEVGFLVPTYIQNQRLTTPTINNAGDSVNVYIGHETIDVGDVQLYTKFKRSVAEHCAMAGGVEISLPTGIERKSFGTGEFGVNPFLSTRYQNGRFAVGAHIGYQIFTGNVDDVLNYSVEVIARGNENVALRTELSGRVFTAAGTQWNDTVLMPGLDFNVTPNLTLRPTGLVGMTNEALDWGIGVGIAYTL